MTTTPPTVSASSRPRAAAGVLFINERGEVLMVEPSYKDHLDIPGGGVEPGESPLDAARREVEEELSIAPPLGRLLVIDWWAEGVEPDGGSRILFIFDSDPLTTEQLAGITVDGQEIVGVRFVAASALGDVTIPRLANRLSHAIEAKRENSIRYLESGVPIV